MGRERRRESGRGIKEEEEDKEEEEQEKGEGGRKKITDGEERGRVQKGARGEEEGEGSG